MMASVGNRAQKFDFVHTDILERQAVKILDLRTQRVSVVLGANDFGRGSVSKEGSQGGGERADHQSGFRRDRDQQETGLAPALVLDDPHDVCFAETAHDGVGSGGRIFVSDNSRIYELDLDDPRSTAKVLCGGLTSFAEEAEKDLQHQTGIHQRNQRRKQGQERIQRQRQSHSRQGKEQGMRKQDERLMKPLRGYRDGTLAEALFDRPDGLVFDAETSIL